VKVGDVVQHKTFGHIGILVELETRSRIKMESRWHLIVWSNWPNLPQANNQTWAAEHDIEVISETQG